MRFKTALSAFGAAILVLIAFRFTSLSLLIHRTEILFHSTHAKKVLLLGTLRGVPISPRVSHAAPTSADSMEDTHRSRIDDVGTSTTLSPAVSSRSITASSTVPPSPVIFTDLNGTHDSVLDQPPHEGEQATGLNSTNQYTTQTGLDGLLEDSSEIIVAHTGVNAEALNGAAAQFEVNGSKEEVYTSNDSAATSDESSSPTTTDDDTSTPIMSDLTNATDTNATAASHEKKHQHISHTKSNPEWKPNLPAELAPRIRNRLDLNKKVERLPGGAIRERSTGREWERVGREWFELDLAAEREHERQVDIESKKVESKAFTAIMQQQDERAARLQARARELQKARVESIEKVSPHKEKVEAVDKKVSPHREKVEIVEKKETPEKEKVEAEEDRRITFPNLFKSGAGMAASYKMKKICGNNPRGGTAILCSGWGFQPPSS